MSVDTFLKGVSVFFLHLYPQLRPIVSGQSRIFVLIPRRARKQDCICFSFCCPSFLCGPCWATFQICCLLATNSFRVVAPSSFEHFLQTAEIVERSHSGLFLDFSRQPCDSSGNRIEEHDLAVVTLTVPPRVTTGRANQDSCQRHIRCWVAGFPAWARATCCIRIPSRTRTMTDIVESGLQPSFWWGSL